MTHEIDVPPPHANPWVGMWYRPRATIRSLLAAQPTHREHILATLSAFSDGLGVAVWRNWGDRFALVDIFALCLLFAPLNMLVYLYLYPVLARWTGRWLGGRGTTAEIRTATAWSFVPLVWLALLWIPELALFGAELFQRDQPTLADSRWRTVAFFGLLGLEVAVTLWFIAVFFVGLAEAQRFPIWKAPLNFILAWLVLVLPLYVAVAW